MRILITGDKGFIGSHLTKKLRNIGLKVFGFDLKIGYNIRDRRQVDNAFELFNPDIVIHLAALTGVRLSEKIPKEYFKTNVMGLYNVLEESTKRKIQQFLFASSSSVYGDQKCPLNEKMLHNPISIYGLTKEIGEKMCKYFSKYFSVIVFRPFTVYGERGRKDMVVSKLIEAGREEKVFEQYGDGSSVRGYTNVHDLVYGIVKLIGYKPPDNFDDFNFGGDKIISLKELISIIKEEFPNLKVEQVSKNPADVDESYADTTKAFMKLGWRPKRDFYNEIIKLCQYRNYEYK